LPNALKNYSYLDGDIYALPGTPSIQLLFYRKDLFEDTRLKRLYFVELLGTMMCKDIYNKGNAAHVAH